jgi:ABC-2 type transport system permease protein
VKEYWILLKRELKSITREKTIMFAILIQFFVASLSSIILVGIMAFYDPSSISQNTHARVSVAVVEDRVSGIVGCLQSGGIDVWSFPQMGGAERAFKEGKVDAIMVLPKSQSGVVDMKLILPELDTQQTVVMMMLQEPLKNYEDFLRAQNGVKLSYRGFSGRPSNTFEFLYTLIIPILMLFPALIAGSIMIDSVSEEFQNKTMDTLMAAPVSLKQVFSAKISAAVITAIAQVILWTFLLRLNGLEILDPALVILIAVAVAAAISFIAAFIALYFKDRERAQFIYSIVLIILVAVCYFVGTSPLNLITRIASGMPDINLGSIAIYLAVFTIMGGIFFKLIRKMVFLRH